MKKLLVIAGIAGIAACAAAEGSIWIGDLKKKPDGCELPTRAAWAEVLGAEARKAAEAKARWERARAQHEAAWAKAQREAKAQHEAALEAARTNGVQWTYKYKFPRSAVRIEGVK